MIVGVVLVQVDEKPTESYQDVGGLEKQMQEMIEAIVLPMTLRLPAVIVFVSPLEIDVPAPPQWRTLVPVMLLLTPLSLRHVVPALLTLQAATVTFAAPEMLTVSSCAVVSVRLAKDT